MNKKHTCDELGVCQQRAECHLECACPPQQRYPFAPGVIDLGEPVSRMDVLGGVLLGLALAAGLGFAIGYVATLAGWLS